MIDADEREGRVDPGQDDGAELVDNGPEPTEERYSNLVLEGGDQVVIFDRRNHRSWIQSDFSASDLGVLTQ